MSDSPIGVVLLAMGGPERNEDVEPFLAGLLGDPLVVPIPLPGVLRRWIMRRVARRRAPEVIEKYREMGQLSPQNRQTEEQAALVQAALKARGVDAAVRPGFRYTSPLTTEAVAELRARGCRTVVGLSMFPHACQATTGTAFKFFRYAVKQAGGVERVVEVVSYPEEPGLLDAWERAIRADIKTFSDPLDTALLFSAHGVPESLQRKGDPYLGEVRRTVEALGKRFENPRSLSFQSRVGPVRWVPPATSDMIVSLARANVPRVLLVPIAFTTEHIETLHELDIELRQMARSVGIQHLARAPVPWDAPSFIDGLARLVEGALAKPSG